MTVIQNKEPIIGSTLIKYEPAVEPGRAEVKKFRIHAKRLFLTYSRTDLTLLEVLTQLQEKFSNLKYLLKDYNPILITNTNAYKCPKRTSF
jgi:hypothetical protein